MERLASSARRLIRMASSSIILTSHSLVIPVVVHNQWEFLQTTLLAGPDTTRKFKLWRTLTRNRPKKVMLRNPKQYPLAMRLWLTACELLWEDQINTWVVHWMRKGRGTDALPFLLRITFELSPGFQTREIASSIGIPARNEQRFQLIVIEFPGEAARLRLF